MNRITLVVSLISTLLLSGCISTKDFTPQELDRSFYVIDTYTGNLCIGLSTSHCINLSVMVADTLKLSPIEKAYNQKVEGPNYPRSLMRLLLKPNDQSYTAESLDSTKRSYRLPKNEKTDLAWDTLSDIYKGIHE